MKRFTNVLEANMTCEKAQSWLKRCFLSYKNSLFKKYENRSRSFLTMFPCFLPVTPFLLSLVIHGLSELQYRSRSSHFLSRDIISILNEIQ